MITELQESHRHVNLMPACFWTLKVCIPRGCLFFLNKPKYSFGYITVARRPHNRNFEEQRDSVLQGRVSQQMFSLQNKPAALNAASTSYTSLLNPFQFIKKIHQIRQLLNIYKNFHSWFALTLKESRIIETLSPA